MSIEQEVGPNAGAAIVMCYNPEYSFVLKKPSGAREYSITQLGVHENSL